MPDFTPRLPLRLVYSHTFIVITEWHELNMKSS